MMSPAAPAALRAIPTRGARSGPGDGPARAIAFEGSAQGNGGAGLDHGGTEHVHGDVVAGDGGHAGHAQGDAIGPALGAGGGDEASGGDGAGRGDGDGKNGQRSSGHDLRSGNGHDSGLISGFGMGFQPGQGPTMDGQGGGIDAIAGRCGEIHR